MIGGFPAVNADHQFPLSRLPQFSPLGLWVWVDQLG
jgi:hypothetical protein